MQIIVPELFFSRHDKLLEKPKPWVLWDRCHKATGSEANLVPQAHSAPCIAQMNDVCEMRRFLRLPKILSCQKYRVSHEALISGEDESEEEELVGKIHIHSNYIMRTSSRNPGSE